MIFCLEVSAARRWGHEVLSVFDDVTKVPPRWGFTRVMSGSESYQSVAPLGLYKSDVWFGELPKCRPAGARREIV